MSDNRKYLINHLSSGMLDGRFSNIVPINCDPDTGEKIGRGGALSLVFRAIDQTIGRPVAIKFFDPAFTGIGQPYRLAAFERESQLLEIVHGSERCLHLVEPLHELEVQIPAAGTTITVTYFYFVLEWLVGDIQDYFYRQETFDAIAKLLIFRECLLAVFALHHHEVFHRDLKADNLMQAHRAAGEVVVAIDLGTAAKFDSTRIGDAQDYFGPVGAKGFAPLEAFFGLSAIRQVGARADIYALGCLLHDLFNIHFFYERLLGNRGFVDCRAACERHMIRHGSTVSTDPNKLMTEWRKIVRLTKGQVTLPGIADAPESTTPAAVRGMLDQLLASMVAIDLEDRQTDPNILLRRLDTAIKILRHEISDQQARERRKNRRSTRIDLAKRKAEKLQKYLAGKS